LFKVPAPIPPSPPRPPSPPTGYGGGGETKPEVGAWLL